MSAKRPKNNLLSPWVTLFSLYNGYNIYNLRGAEEMGFIALFMKEKQYLKH